MTQPPAPHPNETRNTIRSWALVATAVLSLVLIGFGVWLVALISSDWCAAAIGAAEDAKVRPAAAVQACFALLNLQVKALASNSFVVLVTFGLCLLVLVVIVLAGGRLSFTANPTGGLEGSISGDKVEGARQVEEAAKAERRVIEQEVEGN